MLNISQVKGHQTMKFVQLIEHPKKNTFLEKLCRKWGRETSSRRLFLKKSFILGKSKWSAAWFHSISIALKSVYNRNKLFKTLHYWFRDMLNFDFLDKGLGIVSPAHFVYDFSTKMFLVLYSINWPNFIAWLPLLLEILGNMCVAIVCLRRCDVINFKIKLIFLIKPFLYMTKKWRRKLKNFENEKSF